MPSPVGRLRTCGILDVRDGELQMSGRFLAHLSAHQHRGRVPSWDILALLESAVSAWDEYAGDARESAKALARFLPAGSVHATPAFPVLDAYIAA